MGAKDWKEDRLDAFFNHLSKDLSDEVYRADYQFARNRLLSRMKKRAAYRAPHLRAEAFAKFLANNDRVGTIKIDDSCPYLREMESFIWSALARYYSRLDPNGGQGVLHYQEIVANWRFGPGASVDALGTHAVEKFVSSFSSTGPAVPLVTALRETIPGAAVFDSKCGHGNVHVVRGSKLTTVPKNEDVERTIATEPLGNMTLQLGAGRYLEGVLAMLGLDITNQQPKNKHLAWVGSVSGRVATIDMSLASDSISLALVRSLFPREWVNLLFRLRSSETLIEGTWHKLNMVSTMGNGFTFPLMTLIFTAAVYANRRINHSGPPNYVSWSETAVFGDDIIVPSNEAETLCALLEKLGFIVNTDKSFTSGPFRESCGGDYFEGTDVTPFYVQRLDTPSAIYTAINQVQGWCGRFGVVLPCALRYLYGLLQGRVFLVPEWCNPDQGVLTSGCPRRFSYLHPVVNRLRVGHEHPFLMRLVTGGYVENFGSHLVGTPRSDVTAARYEVRRSRLPEGYLDGWCADKRPAAASNHIRLVTELFTC